jgi:hypothetical protein
VYYSQTVDFLILVNFLEKIKSLASITILTPIPYRLSPIPSRGT